MRPLPLSFPPSGAQIASMLFALALSSMMMAPVALADERGPSSPAGDISVEWEPSGEQSADGQDAKKSTSVDSDPSNKVDVTQRADSSFIYETDIAELAQQAELFDRQTVQVSGEAVGDIVAASDPNYRWVVIMSTEKSSYAEVIVYMTAKQASLIETLGRYNRVGTILQVTGTFYEADPELEGAQNVRATSVSVLAPGRVEVDAFDPLAFAGGGALLVLGFALLLGFNYMRERQR
ncbi:hypothetical protein [Gordonibacter sp. Marseille-P4307]|uniref:hypothetical protein n=1 Tax=Gordonibacter sp. Marseille-P4307 TaxID=2161815 RepID=UPI000F53005E|nr:hypothetical protein [Gordonibacter sp. Marseille-P4307]